MARVNRERAAPRQVARSHRGPATAGTRSPSDEEVQRFQQRILAWFTKYGRAFPWRHPGASLYRRLLPEFLLQRTRAEVVASFLPQFLRRYPSWRALGRAREEDLGELLRPLGLWRRRAASLRALARALSARGGRLPRSRAQIDELPGVGQYIANAISLFAWNQAEPLLDVNMARVIERCFGPRVLADIRYDPGLQAAARRIVSGVEAIRINWAILDLAALVCHKVNPRCLQCPVLKLCAHGRERLEASRLPISAPTLRKAR